MRVELHPQAEQELEEALGWLDDIRTALSTEFAVLVEDTLALLAARPPERATRSEHLPLFEVHGQTRRDARRLSASGRLGLGVWSLPGWSEQGGVAGGGETSRVT